MEWLLLNQYIVKSMDSVGLVSNSICVLESVVSSDRQLVQVLVSGTVSPKTMTSLGHGHQWNNLEYQGEA